MTIVKCRADLWRLFYNVHDTLTVIVSNVYLFHVSFASLDQLVLKKLHGLVLVLVLVSRESWSWHC